MVWQVMSNGVLIAYQLTDEMDVYRTKNAWTMLEQCVMKIPTVLALRGTLSLWVKNWSNVHQQKWVLNPLAGVQWWNWVFLSQPSCNNYYYNNLNIFYSYDGLSLVLYIEQYWISPAFLWLKLEQQPQQWRQQQQLHWQL